MRAGLWLVVVLVVSMRASASAQNLDPVTPLASATHVATQSGPLADAATWGGRALSVQARLAIPSGITVTVTDSGAPELDWIRVDGTLRFDPKQPTALTFRTITVSGGGFLEIGTAATPATAVLTVSGGDFDHGADPLEVGQGIVAHGRVVMHGKPIAHPFVATAVALEAGMTRARPDVVPADWKAGDRLVVTSSIWGHDEVVTFDRIEKGEIVWREPLKNSSAFPNGCDIAEKAGRGCRLHIGNWTRSVVIRSDPANAGNPRLQGHVMLMSHHAQHDLRYVELVDLGRTTISPVTDPILDSKGNRDPSLCPPYIKAENIRGRYALHFHNPGPLTNPLLQVVEGVSIRVKRNARLKFGVINHSSNVNITKSLSHNIDGSHFMTEEGNEIGVIDGNLAVYSQGANLANIDQPREILMREVCPDVQNRRRLDMGWNGTGFWLHSGGLVLNDNVGSGHTQACLSVWTNPLDKPNGPPHIKFEVKYLRPGSVWPHRGDKFMPVDRVPWVATKLVCYAGGHQRNGRASAMEGEYGLQAFKNPSLGKALLKGLLGWNLRKGLDTEYTGSVRLEDAILIAGIRARESGSECGDLQRQNGGNNDAVNVSCIGFKECLNNDGKGSSNTNVSCHGSPAMTAPPPPPSAEPSPPSEPQGPSRPLSADRSRMPPLPQIVAADGAIWTMDSEIILRNGRQASRGAGSQVALCGGTIYALGTNRNWYRWLGRRWQELTPADPCETSGIGSGQDDRQDATRLWDRPSPPKGVAIG